MVGNKYMGIDTFTWFQGVVEDRYDPLMLGRCKVRCLGFHDNTKEKIPTKDLPWAHPIQPMGISTGMNGIGQTPLGPVEGTWVVGFFRDGINAQEPLIFGVIGGIPESRPPDGNGSFPMTEEEREAKGFCDESGTYPKWLDEPDTNRLARSNEGGHRILSQNHIAKDEFYHPVCALRGASSYYASPVWLHEDATGSHAVHGGAWQSISGCEVDDTGIGASQYHGDGVAIESSLMIPRPGTFPLQQGDSWNEPLTTSTFVWDDYPELENKHNKTHYPRYHSSYPKNHVYETESGHVREYDDTPMGERIHEYHTAGTFYEIDASGAKSTRVVANNYVVIFGTNHIYIKGDCNITVDGNETRYIKGNQKIHIGGTKTEYIQGDSSQRIDGTMCQNVRGPVSEYYESTSDKIVDKNVTERFGINSNTYVGVLAGGGNSTFVTHGHRGVETMGNLSEMTWRIHQNVVFANSELHVTGNKKTTVAGDVHRVFTSNYYTMVLQKVEEDYADKHISKVGDAYHQQVEEMVLIKSNDVVNIYGGPNINLNNPEPNIPDEPTAPEQPNYTWRHAPTFYNCPKTDWHEEHPPGTIQPY